MEEEQEGFGGGRKRKGRNNCTANTMGPEHSLLSVRHFLLVLKWFH